MIYKKTMYKSRSKSRGMQSRERCSFPDEARIRIAENDCVSVCREYGYPSLAMVYGASQCWRDIDDGPVGFSRGTIFGELDKPFMGDRCRNGGYCK